MVQLSNNLRDLKKAQELLESPELTLDFLHLICGAYISGGCYREVFEYNLDSRFVVKVEKDSDFSNIYEKAVWEEVQWLQGPLAWVKEWFAPIKWISPGGRIMLMRRTESWARKKEYPDKVPGFFQDVKLDNFGWLDGKFVCHDYAYMHGLIHYPKKMAKVDWFGKQ